jgi:hypothetical protein
MSLCHCHLLIPRLPARNLLDAGNLQRLLDEQLSEEQISELEEQEAMVKRFLSWDLDATERQLEDGKITIEDIKKRIAEVLNVEWDPETGDITKAQGIAQIDS